MLADIVATATVLLSGPAIINFIGPRKAIVFEIKITPSLALSQGNAEAELHTCLAELPQTGKVRTPLTPSL